MHLRFSVISDSTAVATLALLLPLCGFAQAPESVAQTTPSAKVTTTKTWASRRTPDGQPDLQGIWSNASNVPLQRPVEGQSARGGPRVAQAAGQLEVHYDLGQYGLDRSHEKVAEDTRLSLVTTPDGRIPPLVPEAQKRAALRAAYNREHQWDGPESRPLAERCILWPNEGPPMLPPGYNPNVEIVQSPGYVAIEQEMIHDVRLIPTDGRPHLPTQVRQLMGDSVGHWEGNTLVVDTTNFTGRTAFQNSSESLHVVERFTRTAEDTLLYEFTAEDPHTWATPWSAQVVWAKTAGPLYEYACHEANYGMKNNLSGARAVEKKAVEEVANKPAN